MGLDGVEIFTNSSGSHHELRKLHKRIELIKEATQKVGLTYETACWLLTIVPSPEVFICTQTNKAVMAIAYTTTAVRSSP